MVRRGGTHSFLDNTTERGPFAVNRLDYPTALRTLAYGINGAGRVVGFFYYPSFPGIYGFVDDAGFFTPFFVRGAIATEPFGINAAGQIVGDYTDASGEHEHGFVVDAAGVYTDAFRTLDVPGATDTRLYGINAAGQIVGDYTDASGDHAFVATPTATTAPEPGTWALLGTGLLAVGGVARRRRSPA